MSRKVIAYVYTIVLVCLTSNLFSTSSYVTIDDGYARLDNDYNIVRVMAFMNNSEFTGTPEVIALQYINSRISLFFLDPDADIEFVEERLNPSGTHVYFQQVISKVPVLGSEIIVSLNKSDVITMVVNNYKPLVAAPTSPQISEENAILIASNSFNDSDLKTIMPIKSKLTIYVDEDYSSYLVWKLNISPESGGDWQVLVDAITGDVVKKEDYGIINFGQVFDPDPCTFLNDLSLPDNNDQDYPELSPAYKTRDLIGLNPPESGLYYLRGEYVYSEDIAGPSDPPTSEPTQDFIYNRSEIGFEETNCYYHLDKTIRYVRGLGFNPLWYDQTTSNEEDIVFDANGKPDHLSIGASYYPLSEVILFGVSTDYFDAGEDQSVIAHELGHALHDALLIGGAEPINECFGIGEGIADYLNISYRRSIEREAGLPYFRPNARSNWLKTIYVEYEYSILPITQANFSDWFREDSNPDDEDDEIAELAYFRMQIWASALMDLEYLIGTDPSYGIRLGRDVVTTLQLASLGYVTRYNSGEDNVIAMYQASIDIYGEKFLRDLMEVYSNRLLFDDQIINTNVTENTIWQGVKLINADITIEDGVILPIQANYLLIDGDITAENNSYIIIPKGGKTIVEDDVNITLKENSTLEMYKTVVLDAYQDHLHGMSYLHMENGSNLLLFNETKIDGNLHAYCSGTAEVQPYSVFHLENGADFTIENGGKLTLLAGSKIIVHEGSNLTLESGALIEAHEGAEIVIEKGGTLQGMSASITSTNWQGITAVIGSSIILSNTSISNAVCGLNATAASVNITSSSFTDCENGVSLINCEDYVLDYNHFDGKGIEEGIGSGISLTYCSSPITGNAVSNFGIGIKLVSSTLTLAKNTITDNTNNGLFITGNGSKPTLVDVVSKDLSQKSINNDIVDNALNSPFYSRSQIFMRYSAGAYMTNGYNNIYSGEIGSIPTIPCIKGIIQLDPSVPVISRINIAAEMNYWGYPGIDERNQAFFFSLEYNPWGPDTGYSIDYDPYGLQPFTEGEPYPAGNLSSNEPPSTESTLLFNAMRLEQDDKYTASTNLYEKIIEDYPNSEEYYVAMARLPYVYEEIAEPLDRLINIYDEALASEEITNKKFFKEMKVSTKIKNKKYDEAIMLAEEMKSEATTDEEKALSDIDIAIANMMKYAESKGKSATDHSANISDLLAKLTGDEEKGEKADVVGSVLPTEFALYQNYPNPFNPTTEIKFDLPTASDVKLNVYNINGQIVSELVNENKEAGVHRVNFDASNFNSGMYFYTLETKGIKITKKMILTK